MKKCMALMFALGVFFGVSSPVYATLDPLSQPNNKFGVHIVDENDLEDAAELVNSSGGEWGYVTMVIREDERDVDRWQAVFDRMRELKLIPIVRLATKGISTGWEKPTNEDAVEWAQFLNELNWVVQNRYVILFNEPNHAHEWEGSIEPAEYARIARRFYEELNKASPDFFILPAGFDQAADNTGTSMGVERYYRSMYEYDPEIFTIFDGWTSHAYPNPNFSGSITASGRRSIKGYAWELRFLSAYGLPQNIPVFVTETGWAHREGTTEDPTFRPAEEVAELFKIAYTDVWDDPQIVMVSPFLLNYQAEPFDNFSWRKPGSSEYYPQFSAIAGLSKESGLPVQIDLGTMQIAHTITSLTPNARFFVPIRIHNTGQTIWQPETDTELMVFDSEYTEHVTLHIPSLKPFQSAVIKLPIVTPSHEGEVIFSVALKRKGTQITDPVTFSIPVREPDSSQNSIIQFIRELVLREVIEVVFAAN